MIREDEQKPHKFYSLHAKLMEKIYKQAQKSFVSQIRLAKYGTII